MDKATAWVLALPRFSEIWLFLNPNPFDFGEGEKNLEPVKIQFLIKTCNTFSVKVISFKISKCTFNVNSKFPHFGFH